MATRTKKPAARPATKPAAKQPAVKQEVSGVGIKELAADLGGKNPRAVRAAIRRLRGGAQVGRGGRYHWDSKADPDYKELLGALSAKSGGDE